jgi:hypothetical protein
MKQTAISTIEPGGDGSNKGMTSVFHSLNPVEKTAAQVNILRGILDTTHDFLIAGKSATEGFEVDGESIKEARQTAAMAFMQLRHIIDDQPRWEQGNGEAEAEAKKLLEAEVAKAEADGYLKDQLSRPCYLLRAKIFRTQGGQLVAVNDTQSVTGFGATAAEAFDEFDKNFFEQQHLPVETTPPPVSEKLPVRKNPKKKK